MADEDSKRQVHEEILNAMNATWPPANHGLSIERKASVVTIRLTCADEYAAIELYERLTVSAKAGNLKLELKASGS